VFEFFSAHARFLGNDALPIQKIAKTGGGWLGRGEWAWPVVTLHFTAAVAAFVGIICMSCCFVCLLYFLFAGRDFGAVFFGTSFSSSTLLNCLSFLFNNIGFFGCLSLVFVINFFFLFYCAHFEAVFGIWYFAFV